MEQRIQEIRELEKLATPGPWERVDDILCLEKSKALCCTWPNFASEDDWILVRTLRNNILAILDDNDRLRAVNKLLAHANADLRGDKPTMLGGTYISIVEHERQTDKLQAENAQLQRERDAAVADVEGLLAVDISGEVCEYCVFCDGCAPSEDGCTPRWRGPQEVEHDEEVPPEAVQIAKDRMNGPFMTAEEFAEIMNEYFKSLPSDDPCEGCVHWPPSSFGGKPCFACEPRDDKPSCYRRQEVEHG